MAQHATWQGDSDVFPIGHAVELLACDNAGRIGGGDVPARTPCWVRAKLEGGDHWRYRSCDLGDLDLAHITRTPYPSAAVESQAEAMLNAEIEAGGFAGVHQLRRNLNRGYDAEFTRLLEQAAVRAIIAALALPPVQSPNIVGQLADLVSGGILSSFSEIMPNLQDDTTTLGASITSQNGIQILMMDSEYGDTEWRVIDLDDEKAMMLGKTLIRWASRHV